MWAKNKQNAFTIVELLIVIVVISVLAAISIVAFTGIQQRARYTQQLTRVEEIGKAINFYRAEGGTMNDGVAGAVGRWYGGSGSVYAGTLKSMRQALIDQGHLSTSSLSTFMTAPCTDVNDDRRVVMAKVTPIPEKTVIEQISESNCNSAYISTYSDPNQQYKMNIGKVF